MENIKLLKNKTGPNKPKEKQIKGAPKNKMQAVGTENK